MRVLSIDPGGTTGYVDVALTDSIVVLRPSQDKDTCGQLYTKLKSWQPEFILCENFSCRAVNNPSMTMISAHLIGVMKLYGEQHNVPYMLTEPMFGEGGHFTGMKALKRYGVYAGGAQYHHAMSAMRIFMQWFTFGYGYKYNKKQPLELSK